MARTRRGTRRNARSNPQGILSVTNDGFGFVQTAEGEFFIPARKMGTAFDGDMVEVAPSHPNYERPQQGKEHNRPGKRPSARVVRVVQRAHETLVGRFEACDPFGVVVPIDHHIPFDIFTPLSDNPDIPDGAMVRVSMVEYPSRSNAATGVIEEVLGLPGQPALDIETIIAHHKLSTRFSEQALAQAQQASVDEQAALSEGYRDIRSRFVFTIDPDDACDFDDALSVEKLPAAADNTACWRLGIHIADVSHYVAWGSELDVEAQQRATSVYLVDRVVPMLPEKLSNDVCSLAPGCARRAMSVDVLLDEDMQVCGVDAYSSVIESKARLSYRMADCMLEAFRGGKDSYAGMRRALEHPAPQGFIPLDDATAQGVFDALTFLTRFACERNRQRRQTGGIDFEATEAKVQLDAAGVPVGVTLRRKTPATACVEEAMILANECVAKLLLDAHMPGIFRVHEPPLPDALVSLVPVLQEFDYVKQVGLDAVLAGDPCALAAVLDAASGRPEAELVSQLVLRSMQRAVYRSDCAGHYGLGLAAYCHFTSPIRRYPDLVVHRMLRAVLCGKGETFEAQVAALDRIAEHSSQAERTTEAASRESQDVKLVEYMRQFVGQRLEGIVSGVTTYGLYVRLENTAEGVLPMRELGEYFSFDPSLHRLTGQDTGRVFRLGQQVSVVLHAAPEHATRLDFRLAD